MKFSRTIFTIALTLASSISVAGSASNGVIKNVKVHNASPSPVLMFTTVPYSEPPTCLGSPASEWAVKLDDFGKSVYAMVLSAQAQNKNVTITGTHSCGDWGDRESIFHISIVD